MRPGTACAPVAHDPPRPLSEVERALVEKALATAMDGSALAVLMDRATVVEDCAGCAAFYCRSEYVRHDMIGELQGQDEDGMKVDCLVFVDDEGLWGADIHRVDGQPWKAMPDPSTFQPSGA